MGISGFAQVPPYNPYTQNIHYSPEPTAQGIHNCGPIDAIFTMGMTTQDDAVDWTNNPLIIRICANGFEFRGNSATAIVYGNYSEFFSWTLEGDSCLVGTQSDTIHGTGTDLFNIHPDAAGLIGVKMNIPPELEVPSFAGIDINLIVPAYMSTYNVLSDDPESSYTQNYISHTTISGSVFNDPTVGDTPMGTPIGAPSNTNVYINVVDAGTSLVEGTTMVPNTGSYLVDSLSVNTTYDVQISTNQGIKGQLAPPIQLPAGWTFADEDCCDSLSSDGLANGELDEVSASTCPVEHANFGISNAIPLPVKLSSFTVTEINCNPVLNWTSSLEENISHYEILRKEEGMETFELISQIEAKESNTNLKRYTLLDEITDQSKKNFQYQLRIVDQDKKYSFSEIKFINLNCNDFNRNVSLAPNPASDKINFMYFNNSINTSVQISILDVTGRLLDKNVRNILSGQNNLLFDVSTYTQGTYFLQYNDLESNEQGTLKFTIK